MLALHFLLPLGSILRFPVTLVGMLPVAVGLGLNLAADSAFRRHGTTVKPFERSSRLVTTGVFSATRNPMYLGMALGLLGVALLLGTLTPFIVVGIFAALVDRCFIRVEERMLAETFGAAWLAYSGRTRRWL
jgi:protein-S-isoprenylcysteine O-methyltransferase Ste14